MTSVAAGGSVANSRHDSTKDLSYMCDGKKLNLSLVKYPLAGMVLKFGEAVLFLGVLCVIWTQFKITGLIPIVLKWDFNLVDMEIMPQSQFLPYLEFQRTPSG
ncbi:hypothetical protein AVEN_112455-1 [Araneus ventricosus]|nr:hypothetical protein AVEN_112455-1 [Araneus ventricosus]